MNRKGFLKYACGFGIGSCLGMRLFTNDKVLAAEDQKSEPAKTNPLVPVDPRQIQNVLSYIESD